MRDPFSIIHTARITEKGTALQERGNAYVFQVAKDATKIEIRQAIEAIFKKKVRRVNTMHVRGKVRRSRFGQPGRTNSWKKAVVVLADGEKLDLI